MSAVFPASSPVPHSSPGLAPTPVVEPHQPSAAERLEASRARVRSALMEITHPPPKPSLLDGLGFGSFGSQILERLKSLPGVSMVVDGVEHWWTEHPLHAAAGLAEEAGRRYVGPMARKNPIAIIVGGAVFGALLIASKPWRWLLRPALFVGLASQIVSHTLKRMPLDSWLQMLSAVSGKEIAAKRQAAPDPASGLPKDR